MHQQVWACRSPESRGRVALYAHWHRRGPAAGACGVAAQGARSCCLKHPLPLTLIQVFPAVSAVRIPLPAAFPTEAKALAPALAQAGAVLFRVPGGVLTALVATTVRIHIHRWRLPEETRAEHGAAEKGETEQQQVFTHEMPRAEGCSGCLLYLFVNSWATGLVRFTVGSGCAAYEHCLTKLKRNGVWLWQWVKQAGSTFCNAAVDPRLRGDDSVALQKSYSCATPGCWRPFPPLVNSCKAKALPGVAARLVA